ncbi:ester cyclase [Enterococcus saccharolyticus]|uniref:ester cyclase n=1 Tax=Enterococcus saccharolyticus TaxID=41997 RepID=UPI001E51B2C5|nr:ester cyclase [Enterococcus saccharolyticus]MCD5001830.1 ester cyclase [Enterococcus saccharolyticus]
MTSETIIRRFFADVRSGKKPDKAHQYMAEKVLAHQVIAEEEQTIYRTPEDYATHVKEMVAAYGHFSLDIQELLASENKVYVRWRQTGTHIGEVDGYQPTKRPIIEIASAVYKLENDKIIEYWIQIDRLGIQKQLERNQEK